MQQKMNAKNLMVSFVIIASVLLLGATVSASGIAHVQKVKIDGVRLHNSAADTIIAGDTITVEAYFTAIQEDKDVTVTATIDTGKEKAEATTSSFRVSQNGSYMKTLTLKVPYELKNEVEDNAELTIEIEGKDYDTEVNYALTVERPQYDSVVKSVIVPNNVEAGQSVPVEFVIRNTGYYDLEDAYVTVSIPALDISKKVYLGDIYALKGEESITTLTTNNGGLNWTSVSRTVGDKDNEDVVSGKVYLEIPYEAKSGIYALGVEVSNDDSTVTETQDLVISNDFSAGNVIITSSRKTVATGEDASYDLVIVNPTNKLKVYRIVPESSKDLSSSTTSAVVAVPAGSSKTVTVTASAATEGEYTFNVTILDGETLSDVVTLTTVVEGNTSVNAGNPVVVLTIILAIIFLVLLVVLIVLLGKKPEKTEEFGESYY